MSAYPIDRVTSSPEEGRLSLSGAGATRRTTLTLPSGMSLNSWKRVGKQIYVLSDASCWWLGDWLIYGQEHFPDRYKRAMEETSLDYQTLRNYAWIARKFQPHRRREKLSFQHHAEVAVFAEPEQELWLTRAERLCWSRNELRRRIRAGTESGAKAAIEVAQVKMSITPAQRDHWTKAAESASQELSEWMTATLDYAAKTAIGSAKEQ